MGSDLSDGQMGGYQESSWQWAQITRSDRVRNDLLEQNVSFWLDSDLLRMMTAFKNT